MRNRQPPKPPPTGDKHDDNEEDADEYFKLHEGKSPSRIAAQVHHTLLGRAPQLQHPKEKGRRSVLTRRPFKIRVSSFADSNEVEYSQGLNG
jgi:hypothetical protein